MSYPDPHPSFMQPLYSSGSDAIGLWPTYPMNNENFDPHSQFEQQQQQQQQSPFKRPRLSEDNQSSPSPYPAVNSRMAINPPVNKGITNIFFKTRVCAKFRVGTCRNGENCNFAHGIEDLRQPPPNWQELVGMRDEDRPSGNWDDDQKIIHRMKLCKKFYNGEECPYGDRCNFLHEDPSKFRDDSGRFRESSAISIGTTGSSMGHGSGSNQPEVNRPVNNTNMKPVYWKTKLCTKWETTGQCPFGDKCHFAHGQAELQAIGGRTEGEAGSVAAISTKPHIIPANEVSTMKIGVGPMLHEKGWAKKCLLKFKGPKKIDRIYADWIDDLPLLHNLPNQVGGE